jgi:hypothetical protein
VPENARGYRVRPRPVTKQNCGASAPRHITSKEKKMDPITSSVVIVLGKYALDKGAELGKEVGPKALKTVKEMFTLVLDRVRRDPKGQVIAGEFEQDPETYQKPVEKALDAELEADPDFAAQLKNMLAEYEKAAKAHAAATGVSYAELHGDGALAQGTRAAAASSGGTAISGDVGGDVRLGGQDKPKDR